MAEWRKAEGAAFDTFLDTAAKAKKMMADKPADAGSVAGQLGNYISTMSLQLNVALRSGMLRAKDTMPTRKGAMSGPQMLRELGRVRRETSDLAVKLGDKVARLARLAILERSLDWQTRQPAAIAGYENARRVRSALATASSAVQEAARFKDLAAQTRKAGGLTDATTLAVKKQKVTLTSALAEVDKLAAAASKTAQRLKPLAASEQKQADAAHRAALVAATSKRANPRGAPPAAATSNAPTWQEAPVAAPLQTDEGAAPVEASPEADATVAEEPAAPEPAAPRCNPTGATCGSTNPPDDACCAGSRCVDRFQYSDGEQGIGHCS